MVLSGSHRFSMFPVGSNKFSVFSYVLSGSRRFSVVLVGSGWFSMFFCWLFFIIGSQYSHRFSVVLAGSQWFS